MRAAEHFEGFVPAAEALRNRYHYIPFTVPRDCTRLDVSYHFHCPGNEGGATVDIGVFDTRGTDPFSGGFRGWSGSARRSFSIAPDRATPGYIAGPMPAGTWSILIGFAEIADPGIQWFVTSETEWQEREGLPEEAPRGQPAAPREPVAGGDVLHWYRGDLHTHTEHSDGDNTIAEMAAEALRLGLDFLAITDHNTVSHHAEIDAGRWPLLLLPGEEVTMYWGHCNVWGLREWADFRFVTDEEVQRLLRWVDERGAPISINHPKKVGPPWLFGDPGFTVREVWQAPWRWYNWESVRAWDELLAAGKRVTPVGGSDAHGIPPTPRHPHGPGEPTTWVRSAGLSEAAVVDALLGGRTSVSDGPEGPFVTIEETGDGWFEVEFARAAGSTLVLIADGEPRWRSELATESGAIAVPRDLHFDRYLRAELRVAAPKGREDVRALSAPVYP